MLNTDFPYDVILSHGPSCKDGAAAAWCFWRKLPVEYRTELSKEGGFYAKYDGSHADNEQEDIEEQDEQLSASGFIHVNSVYGAINLQNKGYPIVFAFLKPKETVPIQLISGKRVLILDLDLGEAIFSIEKNCLNVTIVDHHDSTYSTIDMFENQNQDKMYFNINSDCKFSACTLAWNMTHDTPIPPLIRTVCISDNYDFKSKNNLKFNPRYVIKSLSNRRIFRSFVDIEECFENWNENFREYEKIGKTICDVETEIIRKISRQADLGFIRTMNGQIYTICYVQANCLHSDVGISMKYYAQKRFGVKIDFCATWKYIPYHDLVSVSLRDPNPGIDLDVVAKNIYALNMKGGGHSKAASFSFYGLANLHYYLLREMPLY